MTPSEEVKAVRRFTYGERPGQHPETASSSIIEDDNGEYVLYSDYAALQERLETVSKLYSEQHTIAVNLGTEIEAAETRMAGCVEALKFYANEKNWTELKYDFRGVNYGDTQPLHCIEYRDAKAQLQIDHGKAARQALAHLAQSQEG